MNINTISSESCTAAFAGLWRTCDRFISAIFGAILDRSKSCLSRVERFATAFTSHSTALVTDSRKPRAWCKFFTALSAGDRRAAKWHTPNTDKFRVIFPKLEFCKSVALRAKCNQVINMVCPFIAFKQMKRAFVMNWESILCYAATLTGIIIPRPNRSNLARPVTSSRISVPSKPSAASFSTPQFRKSIGRSPNIQTFPIAKVTIVNSRRRLSNYCSASKARYINHFSTYVMSRA